MHTVAGFVGNGHAALDLDMRWGELLEKYDLEYFKASEIEFGFGEFVKHRDDPTKPTDPLSDNEKGLIREIKTAFIDLICDCDEMVGVGAVVILPEYERLLQDSAHAKQVLTLSGLRTASSRNIGTSCRTRRPRPNLSAAFPCLAPHFPNNSQKTL